MKLNTGLTDLQRAGAAKILNTALSDEYVLYTKTRNYHWNVAGPHFHDLHKFFESQYEEIDEIIDEIAERARALGLPAFGTLAEFSKHARLREQPGKTIPARQMIVHLLADHEELIRALRADLEIAHARFKDAGTQDFLTGLMERHEKMAWMLRACLDDGAF